MEPVDRKDAQRGKRGPFWVDDLSTLRVLPSRYPGWLHIPMKTINGQPARGVSGPWGADNNTTEHLKLNFDAFAKLSEMTRETAMHASPVFKNSINDLPLYSMAKYSIVRIIYFLLMLFLRRLSLYVTQQKLSCAVESAVQHLASVMKEKGRKRHERKRSQASRKEEVASIMKEKIVL
eukprot:Em0007g135a